jgi:hypothetical protein
MRIFLAVLLVAASCISCAPTRHIIPLQQGESQISASFGGPLITYDDMVIPVPLISLDYGYGLDTNVTVFGGAHVTSALFGVIQADLGGRYYIPLYPDEYIKGITIGASLNPAIDVWEGNVKLWPEIMSAARWQFGSHNPYLSLSSWIEFASTRAHDQKQEVHFMPSISIGDIYQSTNWDYALEARWIAPGLRNKGVVAEYHGIGGNGTIGLYFSVGRRFGL